MGKMTVVTNSKPVIILCPPPRIAPIFSFLLLSPPWGVDLRNPVRPNYRETDLIVLLTEQCNQDRGHDSHDQ